MFQDPAYGRVFFLRRPNMRSGCYWSGADIKPVDNMLIWHQADSVTA